MRLCIILLLICSSSLSHGQSKEVWQEALQLKKVLLEKHISPREIDDRYSKDVFWLFMDELDPDRMYLTAGEVGTFSGFSDKLDNELNGASPVFLSSVIQSYKKYLLRSEAMINEITVRPIDISNSELLSPDTTWALTEEQLSLQWKSIIRLEVLEDLARERLLKPDLKENDFLRDYEPISRSRTKVKFLRQIRKALSAPEGYDLYVSRLFLRCMATTFDPHSVYLSATQMQNLISSLSTEGFFFGLDVAENDAGEIMIDHLLPGGPAWKSGEMHKGDLLLKLRWEGSEWIEIAGMSEEEVGEILQQSNDQSLYFQLLKADGGEKTVKLRKEKLKSDDDVVRSFILEGKMRIAYIHLPDFYSSWGISEGSRSAQDVAKEILKLRNEKIDGLILDVRFNGGGSLSEAVEMAGIFIDAGPVGINAKTGSDPVTIKDINRGTVYDGPMVLMVNGMSASASEFLGAALQDYHRAIVVGGTTFGKGIGQEMFSLRPGKAEINESASEVSPFGFSMVTNTRIYTIKGASIQGRGLTPDISLPDITSVLDRKEATMPFSMKGDSINKKTYFQTYPTFPIKTLRTMSESRVNKNPEFISLTEWLKKTKEADVDSVIVSDWKSISQKIALQRKRYAEISAGLKTSTSEFKVVNHQFGKPGIEIDSYTKLMNGTWIKNLSEDFMLQEAFHIICDYISIKK